MRDSDDQKNLAGAALRSFEGASTGFSRRGFVQLLTLGGLSLAVLPRAVGSSRQAQALNKEIERVAGLIEKVRAEHPNLPGFKGLERWAAETFPANFGPQDAEILQGALYIETLKLLGASRERKAPAPTPGNVREVFANPNSTGCLRRLSLDKLSKTTRSKMSKLPAFRAEVIEASTAATRLPVSPGGPVGPGGEGEAPAPAACIILLTTAVLLLVALIAVEVDKKNES